jgi:hypothetical protein
MLVLSNAYRVWLKLYTQTYWYILCKIRENLLPKFRTLFISAYQYATLVLVSHPVSWCGNCYKQACSLERLVHTRASPTWHSAVWILHTTMHGFMYGIVWNKTLTSPLITWSHVSNDFFLANILILECNSSEEYGICFLCLRFLVMNSGDGLFNDYT